MEDETQNQMSEEMTSQSPKKDHFLGMSILISAIIIAGAWIYTTGLKYPQNLSQVKSQKNEQVASAFEEKVLPSDGIVLPARWDDLGKKMAQAGVIDATAFEELYAGRGGLTNDIKQLLHGTDNGNLKITQENSGTILNLLWALGISNKNDVLDKGPMMDPRYGGAGRFASTGGWTLAKGDAMSHYSMHQFIELTADQQALVERVAKGIYRPCCGNSVYFPDCNHGMAMLGLLELLASQGVNEEEMYKVALRVNSYWFPDTYLTIAKLMESKGIDWSDVSPQEMLGADYSSAQGYAQVVSQIAPEPQQGGGSGCDTGAGAQTEPQRQQGGCGI